LYHTAAENEHPLFPSVHGLYVKIDTRSRPWFYEKGTITKKARREILMNNIFRNAGSKNAKSPKVHHE
jgi:hypothetical protein